MMHDQLHATKQTQEKTFTSQLICSDPAEGLRRILFTCYKDANDVKANKTQGMSEIPSIAMLKELADLQKSALDEIDSASSPVIDGQSNDDKSVWIPIVKLDKDSRTLLHRYIRQVFPLLRTETSSTCTADEKNRDGSIDCDVHSIGTKDADNGIAQETSLNNKTWVCTLIDRTYFSIASCLASPRRKRLCAHYPLSCIRRNEASGSHV